MLLAERIGFEACTPDKRPVRLIYVANTIHYIVRGRGYFNGVLLSEGDAFWTQKNRFVEYYPDPAEPWTYYWVHFNDDGFDAFLSDCRLPDCMYFHFPGYAQIIEFYRFFNSFPNPSANLLLCKSMAELIRSIHTAEPKSSSDKETQISSELSSALSQ